MFSEDATGDDFIQETIHTGSDLASSQFIRIPYELPEEQLTQQQIDQQALELYQRELAKGLLYEFRDENALHKSEQSLTVKAHLEFQAKFIQRCIKRTAEAIRQECQDKEIILKDAPEGTEGDLLAAVEKLTNALSYEQIALIVLSNILRGVQTGSRTVPPEHKITRDIGQELDFEAFINYLREIDPDLLSYVSKQNLTDSNTRRNKKITGTLATVDDFYEINWYWLTDKQALQVGHFFREVTFQTLGYFELILAMSPNGHRQYAIVLSEAGELELDLIMNIVEKTVAKNIFMIHPPKDWSDEGVGGGWLTPMPYPMNVLVRNSMGTVVSHQAVRALNSLQRTAWEVNPYIYNVLNSLLETNVEIGSFRAFNEELYTKIDNPLIQDPDDLAFSWDDQNLTEEEQKRRNQAYRVAKLWEEEKNSLSTKAMSPRMVVKMAEFFLFHQFGPPDKQPLGPAQDDHSEEAEIARAYHNSYIPVEGDTGEPRRYECFYSPWFMDNRTRCYPGVDTLNPQGSDYQKALMMFHHGSPVTEESKRDLLISIATTYGNGIDKKSLSAREEWALTIGDLLPTVVADPLSEISKKFWTQADEPFQFLALCHEYVNIFVHKIQHEHKVSAGRDATCSGIQITGAMLRDSRTCKLVNVLPADEPQDAYKDVAKEAIKLLKSEEWLMAAVEDREKSRFRRFAMMHKEFQELLAQGKRRPDQAPPEYVRRSYEETRETILENLQYIDRSIAKMPTMLIPYGGSFLTIYGHVKEKLTKKGAKFHTADYTILTHALIQGMGRSLPAFSEVNKWFQSLAKATLATPLGDDEKHSLIWETPAGTKVRQEYMNPNYEKVSAALGESTRFYTNQGEPETLNESKMRTALAANVVHSIDASIIQKAVNMVSEKDPSLQFTAVHDCIYGPSGTFSVLLDAIRRSFYECVKDDLTQHIAENNLPDEEYRNLLPILKKGRAKVTLANLLESEYLFS